jgi:hypothetical protein
MSRDIRIVNMNDDQQIESDKVLKRIGEVGYRNLGSLAKIMDFNSGKALITEGIRVEPSSGMTVKITAGSLLQRLLSTDVLPCVVTADILLTMDAASGAPRIDTVEAQIKSVTDKNDTGLSVIDPETGVITLGAIKRDVKYYLSVQKKLNSTSVTAGSAAILTGTVAISGTIDLSEKYLINIADGEDGSFQEIDLRGVVPTATTRAEIIANINAAVGRTMASSSGNYVVLTGNGVGETSVFEIKPPTTSTEADAMLVVFGILGTGTYDEVYKGVNEWFKIAEIDIDSASTSITATMIRNIDQRSTWASESNEVMLKKDVKYNSSWPVSKTFFREKEIQYMMQESVNSGSLFPDNTIVSTYSLVYTTSGAYLGGVLASNGDIHFVPWSASVGQKISSSGIVSTYALVYTTSGAYYGGVLAPNGDIHFIPGSASVGQKISSSGVVSTYALAYTGTNVYFGGVLAPNGDIHFIPENASVGQKISSSGIVSTYALVYTTSGAYSGGVLAPNGDIHFIPGSASVGQKINSSGIVSTYSLIYTTSGAYLGGVLAPNGDIHFIPKNTPIGQKISSFGVVSTYALVYTTSGAYYGGVLAPNGDIHFIPTNASVGQKINSSGIVSTYSLIYTTNAAYLGGVLDGNGDIHFIPYEGQVGQKISILVDKPFSLALCCSPYLNKF